MHSDERQPLYPFVFVNGAFALVWLPHGIMHKHDWREQYLTGEWGSARIAVTICSVPTRSSSQKIGEFVATLLAAAIVAAIWPTADAALLLIITVAVALVRLLKP